MVEGVEVLERPPAARATMITSTIAVDPPDRGRDLELGAVALDGGRREDELDRKPAAEHVHDVVQHRARRRGHDPHPHRVAGQAPLPELLEAALGPELAAPALDLQVLLADAGELGAAHVELVPSAGRVVADRAERDHGLPVLELVPEPVRVAPPDHAGDHGGLAVALLREREVAVARGMAVVVRDLAPDEALDQALVEQEVVDDRRELADPEDVAAPGLRRGLLRFGNRAPLRREEIPLGPIHGSSL